MTKLLLFFAFVAVTQLSFGQGAISNLFSEYENNDNFSSVTIGPKMFKMISKINLDDTTDPDAKDIIDVINDLKTLKILSSETNTKALYQRTNKKLVGKYDELMKVKSKGSDVKFWVKENGNVIEELLLVVGDEDSFSIISFLGKIDLNKISKLAKSLDIEGAEHLDQIKK